METQKREFVKIELTERLKKQIEKFEKGEQGASELIAHYFLNQIACQEKAPWNE